MEFDACIWASAFQLLAATLTIAIDYLFIDCLHLHVSTNMQSQLCDDS